MPTQTPCKIAVVGAAGRMGLELLKASRGRTDVLIVTGIEMKGSRAVGKDLGELAGFELSGIKITDDLEEGFATADIAIDFTTPDATLSIIEAARKSRIPLISGTTGLDKKALSAFRDAENDIAVLYTPNLSFGIAVIRSLVEQAVRSVGKNWDVEIIEMHHRGKIDAPSGTAMALASSVAGCREVELEEVCKYGRSGRTGSRTESEIGIHSVRGGGVFGSHKVILANKNETIELTHHATSRALFAEGALRAAVFLKGKEKGRYTMNDLLSESRSR